MENIFLDNKLTPKDAETQGLIKKAVSDLEKETTDLAEMLAEGAVYAMGQAKHSINAADLPFEQGLIEEAKNLSQTFESEEAGIGLAAFFQKEEPQFLNERSEVD